MRSVPLAAAVVLLASLPTAGATVGDALAGLAHPVCMSTLACEQVDAAAYRVDVVCGDHEVRDVDEDVDRLVAFTCEYGPPLASALCRSADGLFTAALVLPNFLAPDVAWPTMACP